MAKQKLIVMSADALVYEDLAYAKSLPNFAWLLENGSRVDRVRSIYPTLTYPCHTTMITGCHPDKHGVTKNTRYDHVANPEWNFGHENVKIPDLMDVCKKAGLTTSSVGWPVHGNHPSVDYLVPECWPAAGSPIEAYRECYQRFGTTPDIFREMVDPIMDIRVDRSQPNSSYFLSYICRDIIKKYQPDVLMLHPGVVDNFRHKSGVFTDLVKKGLEVVDEMLGMLIQATKDAGVFEQTNFVLTADHGQLNTVRKLHLNSLFVKRGLITLDEQGNVAHWKAWFHTSGMSGQIVLKDPEDPALYREVYGVLKELEEEGVWGISKVYTAEEYRAMHLDGVFSFVVETDGYSAFGDKFRGPIVEHNPMRLDGPQLKGSHGYHPDKAPRPVFLACGPAIKQGVVLESAELVDGAPTYAKILGVSLEQADGRPLTELLK